MERGLLKSLTTWAIPLSFLPRNSFHDLVLFVSLPLFPDSFVRLPNTVITPATGYGRSVGVRYEVSMWSWPFSLVCRGSSISVSS